MNNFEKVRAQMEELSKNMDISAVASCELDLRELAAALMSFVDAFDSWHVSAANTSDKLNRAIALLGDVAEQIAERQPGVDGA